MPVVQYDYDYYEYGKSRRGSSNGAPHVTGAKKQTPSAKDVNKASIRAVMNADVGVNRPTRNLASRTTTKGKSVVKTNTTKKTVTKVTTKTSTKTTRAKVTSKNLDVPVMLNKKQMPKPKEMSLKNAEVMKNPKVKQKVKAKRRESFLKNFAYSAFGFSILFLICYRSSVINESFLELNNMKSQLENVNTMNAQIESEIQTQTDLSNIETYAKYQLGMQKPKESQIQKVVIEKEDKISTPVIIEEETENFWDSLLNDFVNILD